MAIAPPNRSGPRQHPVGTNHFQFRFHQPRGGGVWATVSMTLFSADRLGQVEPFFYPDVILDCARTSRSANLALMKMLLAVLSAFVLATGSVRAADDTALLNTLGYTTGQSVLLTHMAVGTLADAFVGKADKQEQATTFVDTYINITKGMKDQMSKLIDAGSLSKSDSQFVENTIEVLDLVLREAGDLKDYIGSGKQADAQAYDSSRKKALKEIKTLLSIKD